MKNLLIACLLLMGTTSLFAQDVVDSISYANEMRSFRIHLPNNVAPNTPVPIVFVFHGLGDNMNNFSQIGFSQIGNAENFITVYPQGTNIFGINFWRVGTPFDGGISDTRFVVDLLDTLKSRYLIDENRVYAAGFSLGGFMAELTACEMPDIFAAIASHSGTFSDPNINACTNAKTTPVMHIHGTNDTIINYNGGSYNLVIANFPYQSAQFVLNTWSSVDSCDAVPDSTRLPDIRNDGLTVDKFEYRNCLDNTEVIHIRVNGLGHNWMQANNDWNATPEIWDFFARHTLADRDTSRYSTPPNTTGTGIFNVTNVDADLNIYPNPTTGKFTVSVNYTTNTNIAVYNALGQQTYAIEASNGKSVIDLSTADTGIYFVRLTDVKTGKIVATEKLLVQ